MNEKIYKGKSFEIFCIFILDQKLHLNIENGYFL